MDSRKINAVDYHITDVCNLKCAHCSHFCSLVPSTSGHKPIKQITSDLRALSRFKDHLATLNLMGGEAFLHPELPKIIEIARKLFPYTDINLFTNCTLVNNIIACADVINNNDICVVVSIYPLQKIHEKYEILKNYIRKTYKNTSPIDVGFCSKLLSNNKLEYKYCDVRYNCNQLKNGKLYLCQFFAYFDILKNAFPEKVKIEDPQTYYINLEDENITIDDIFAWQEGIPNLCNHCFIGNDVFEYESWRKSNKELAEFVQ